MKKMLFGLMLTSLATYATATNLPAGAIQAGTLGNETLVHDAMLAAATQATVMGCDDIQDVHFFVAQHPKGKVGKRVWKEIWQFECNNGKYHVGVTFIESPKGGVSFVTESK